MSEATLMEEEKQVSKEVVKETPTPKETKRSGKMAVVLIRSTINVAPDIKKAIKMLGLLRKHVCVVLDDNTSNRGSLVKVKDYTTWGEISSDVVKELVSKRGEKDKNFFRLHPPKGGFERKGIKKSFKAGGALGYRGSMDNLLRRML